MRLVHKNIRHTGYIIAECDSGDVKILPAFSNDLLTEAKFLKVGQRISGKSKEKEDKSKSNSKEKTKKEKKKDKVLEEMGNFKQEQNKYKNASRRGQCASSTTPINYLPKENI